MIKIDKLEKTFQDWSWDPINESWDNSYKKLEEYFKQNKTSRMKATFIFKETKLGNWVTLQRS